MKTTRISHAREIAALIAVGIAYWLTIYPYAKHQMRCWKRRARQIPDPTLRAHALDKLTHEHLNPEAAAFFAVLAPLRGRTQLVRLMVGYQIAYDYLDAINEHPTSAPLHNGLQLHRSLTDAVRSRSAPVDYYRHHTQSDDGGYLTDLVDVCKAVIRVLASTSAIEPMLHHAAERCGEAQSRNHAALVEGDTQLIDWTAAQADRGEYLWWELAAGGISCLALHALFAAAASETTLEEATHIDAAYFPSVCALSALLDSLIDYSHDAQTANHSFTGHYDTHCEAAERFAAITTEAHALLGTLTNQHRHRIILAGIASFYLSAADAQGDFARPIAGRTLECLGPITTPILAVMRLMRQSSHSISAGG